MTVVNKLARLRSHPRIPLVCELCGAAECVATPADATLEALIDHGYERELLLEQKLLVRAEELLRRFPDSDHPLLLAHTAKRSRSTGAGNAEVATALRQDRELHDFLSRRGFLLSARLRFVREAVARYEAAGTRAMIHCSRCPDGRMILERRFFEAL